MRALFNDKLFLLKDICIDIHISKRRENFDWTQFPSNFNFFEWNQRGNERKSDEEGNKIENKERKWEKGKRWIKQIHVGKGEVKARPGGREGEVAWYTTRIG